MPSELSVFSQLPNGLCAVTTLAVAEVTPGALHLFDGTAGWELALLDLPVALGLGLFRFDVGWSFGSPSEASGEVMRPPRAPEDAQTSSGRRRRDAVGGL